MPRYRVTRYHYFEACETVELELDAPSKDDVRKQIEQMDENNEEFKWAWDWDLFDLDNERFEMDIEEIPELQHPVSVYYTAITEYDPDSSSPDGFALSLSREALQAQIDKDHAVAGNGMNTVYRHSSIHEAVSWSPTLAAWPKEKVGHEQRLEGLQLFKPL